MTTSTFLFPFPPAGIEPQTLPQSELSAVLQAVLPHILVTTEKNIIRVYNRYLGTQKCRQGTFSALYIENTFLKSVGLNQNILIFFPPPTFYLPGPKLSSFGGFL